MPGHGSTFVFFFPDSVYDGEQTFVDLDPVVGLKTEKSEIVADQSPLRKIRILVADDSEDNQDMFGESLWFF